MQLALTYAVLTVGALAAPGPAAPQQDGPLHQRAEETAALFVADPQLPDGHFSDLFLKSVPPARMRAILSQFHAQYGAVVGVLPLERNSPFAGTFQLVFAKNSEATLTLGVESTPPFSITLWTVSAPQPSLATFEALGEAFEALPGTSSLSVWGLGDEPRQVFGLREDVSLGVGSTFKLYLLGALVEDIVAGERSWTDTLALEERYQSLPTGFLRNWPVGSSHTLETLAGLMISQSDNTATDHLLFHLGRQRVEAMLETMGNRSPARTTPFPATTELFKMKWIDGGSGAAAYEALDVEGRRRYLEREVAALSMDDIDMSGLAQVQRIDTLEWFASTADLCRAMDWLRRNTEDGPGQRARELLAINPGTSTPRGAFSYVGFKGGSEPGVLNLTFLARAAGGDWFAVAGTWNNPEAAVQESRFVGLVSRALFLLAKAETRGR